MGNEGLVGCGRARRSIATARASARRAAMGDAAEVEDARAALTLIDASRYEPVTFVPWEDDGEKVTRARWLNVFRARIDTLARVHRGENTREDDRASDEASARRT